MQERSEPLKQAINPAKPDKESPVFYKCDIGPCDRGCLCFAAGYAVNRGDPSCARRGAADLKSNNWFNLKNGFSKNVQDAIASM